MLNMDVFIGAAMFILGSVIGSYLNVCIYRIPRKISTAKGRSCCPACGHLIAWYDNVPILSYVILRGKCRSCGGRISPRYMIVEFLTGLSFLLAFIMDGTTVAAVLTCAVLSVLIIIAWIDAEHKIIPDRFVVILLLLGAANIFVSDHGWLYHIIGLFAISVPFLIIALLTNGMGGGDIKLMAAAGLFLGWGGALLSVIIGSVAGAVYAIYLMIQKRADRKSEVPFGPFLALGIGLATLFGDNIIDFYIVTFLA